jgi:hypothetical protein
MIETPKGLAAVAEIAAAVPERLVGFFPLFLRFFNRKSRNCPFFRAFY